MNSQRRCDSLAECSQRDEVVNTQDKHSFQRLPCRAGVVTTLPSLWIHTTMIRTKRGPSSFQGFHVCPDFRVSSSNQIQNRDDIRINIRFAIRTIYCWLIGQKQVGKLAHVPPSAERDGGEEAKHAHTQDFEKGIRQHTVHTLHCISGALPDDMQYVWDFTALKMLSQQSIWGIKNLSASYLSNFLF